MLHRAAADFVLLFHFAFVLFAVLGGVLVLRWPRLAWAHLPVAAWAALVEFAGWICPLTPLEVELRQASGEAGYAGGFVEHYIVGLLYPDALTREAQLALGTALVLFNVVLYAIVLQRVRGRRAS
jgi:uncharacterized protein DUF2784